MPETQARTIPTTTTIQIASAGEMRALGGRLARRLMVGDVVLLHGDLGSGKTTLVQGIAEGFGVVEAVQSPTFTLVAEHEGRAQDGTGLKLYHLDLYRLTDPAELESFGYESYLQPADGISLIEWPERADDWLPDRFLLVRIDYAAEGGRSVMLEAVPPAQWSLSGV
ncbi:MAG: tRNA (adenosine(37)-N6)-threonylcarbamoyltransferase complex ATPase subunit type 1 TsaE [Thermomicrobiales bacterium]